MTSEELCRAYFAALAANDWAALANMVTEEVVYALRGTTPLPQRVSGRDAFIQMSREVFAQFNAARFDNIKVSPLSIGMKMFLAEYNGSWRALDGSTREAPGRVVFELHSDRIARITVILDDASLERITQELDLREPLRASDGEVH